MKNQRKSGILLHPTSLPGPYGIGDIGPEAIHFLYFLKNTKTSIWQILPIHPTGYGNSPYTAYSAFAGNEIFISPDLLFEEGLLKKEDLKSNINFNDSQIDFTPAISLKEEILNKAYIYFKENKKQKITAAFNQNKTTVTWQEDFEYFENMETISHWLNDYALFRTIKKHQKNLPWLQWPQPLRDRNPQAITEAKEKYSKDWNFYRFAQYIFFRQWWQLKQKAKELEITIFGDIPIFVSHDSADVWCHRNIFKLTPQGKPKSVAGVPPDYFSATGQLWGNPLYDWEELKQQDYSWWQQRLATLNTLVDWIRIDHFRGFESYWEVPAKEKTAINGKWKKGPGSHLFKTLLEKIDIERIVAEDLGVITPEVEKLRDQFSFPGMKILHFAFGGGADNAYLPHHHIQNSVIYTGTHDNDTTLGWFQNQSEELRQHVRDYFGISDDQISLKMIRYAMLSVADTAIFPMQDLLELDSKHRMNTPAVAQGNWGWRFQWSQVTSERAGYLTKLNELSNRACEEE